MKILFSNPLELGRTGAGRPYGYLHDYLIRQMKHDVQVILGYELVRELYGESKFRPESLEQGSTSDLLASIDEDLSCDVFLGSGCASLSQIKELRRIKKENWPHGPAGLWENYRPKIITAWFSSHYRHAEKLLVEEYQKIGIVGNPIDPYLVWRDKWEQKWSDALIVPSTACAETYESDPNCAGKVHVAGFGVDAQIFHPPEKASTEDFRVLFAGGNWIRKGLIYLVQAWNNLRFRDGLLTVIGCQPTQFSNMWRTNIQGWVDDHLVPEYYRRSSAFILPTLEEGEALAVLEAMASGLPIVTTRESGAPIEDGKEGLIIPARDPVKLRDALQYLRDNPSERRRMGENALSKARRLTWDLFGQRVLEICEEAAGR